MKKKDDGVLDFKTAVRFGDARSVTRFLGRICNQLLRDEISTDKGRCLGYLCGIMLKGFEVSEFEERLTELEKKLLKEVK